jgi:hypothetical protein
MELLNRYLQAVKFWLPKAQQDDIAAELSEDLHSRIEERETELGRPLQEDEMVAILKQTGPPVVVASRYLPQQSLIGPVLFPVYVFVLKIVALCYWLPWLLVFAGLMNFSPSYRAAHPFGQALGGALGTLWTVAFTSFGAVTIVFAILERVQPQLISEKAGFFQKWDPRKLPPVRATAQNSLRIPRSHSVAEIIVNLAVAAWCLTAWWGQTAFAAFDMRIVLAPVWHDFYYALLLLILANTALAAASLRRPYWTMGRAAIAFVLDCFRSIVVCALFKAQLLSQIIFPNLSPVKAEQIVHAFNLYADKCFPFAVLGCILALTLNHGGRLIRLRKANNKPGYATPLEV